LKSVIQDFLRQNPPIVIIPDLNSTTFSIPNLYNVGDDIRLASSTNNSSTRSATYTGSYNNDQSLTMTASLPQQQFNYLDNPWLLGNEVWVQDINNILFSSTLFPTPIDRPAITITEFESDASQQQLNDILTTTGFNILDDLF
jgi:hypothetical protein